MPGLALLLLAVGLFPTRPSHAQAPAGLSGQIAYARIAGQTENDPGRNEIHRVAPDGSGDETVWSAPRGLYTLVPLVDWRPDGKEIAFTSSHEFTCSRFNNDVFAVAPNGTGLRRITNPPACADLAALPQGSVTITVKNNYLNAFNIFGVYVEGASHLPEITLPWTQSTTLTIDNVADLGREQIVYVKGGEGTWLNPTVYADVSPGTATGATAPFEIENGIGPFQLYVSNFTWKGDGTEIAYHVEAGLTHVMPAHPAVGALPEDVFAGDLTPVTSSLAWAPEGESFLYFSNTRFPAGIYLGTRGSEPETHELILETDRYPGGLDWLPDGSGFLYAFHSDFGFFPDEIGRYAFGAPEPTTLLSGGTMGGADVSPDGRYFVFARRFDENGPYELWGSTLDGAQQWRIAGDVVSYAWGPAGAPDIGATDAEPASSGLRPSFVLSPGYPNPFHTVTNVDISLPEAAAVRLTVFDLLGRPVATLADGIYPPGTRSIRWEANTAPPGVYFVRLQTGTYERTIRLLRVD